jgi:hypothetical protein
MLQSCPRPLRSLTGLTINNVEKEIFRASKRNLKEFGYLFHRNLVEIKILGLAGMDKHLVMELAWSLT